MDLNHPVIVAAFADQDGGHATLVNGNDKYSAALRALVRLADNPEDLVDDLRYLKNQIEKVMVGIKQATV